MLISTSHLTVRRVPFLLLAVVLATALILAILLTAKETRGVNGTSVWLSGPVDPVVVGEQITVTVHISNVTNLYGAQMSLSFVPDDLQVIDADTGKVGVQIKPGDCPVTDFVVANSADNVSGDIEYVVSQFNPTPPINGDCSMAYIQFQTLQITTTSLLFDEVILSDPGGIQIPAAVTGLNIDILPLSPTAAFTATPSSGIAPLYVQFTDLSTGVIDDWQWEFDEGQTSAAQNPLHTYGTKGIYTVSLTVRNLGGDDTETKIGYITVYEEVVADFVGAPTSGMAPLNVDFTNRSNGDYSTCLWNFGDGGNSNDCNDPGHTFTNTGIYTVSLTADGPGGGDTESKSSYISVYEKVVADFVGAPTSGMVPLNVEFTDQSTGDYSTCLWHFGDGGNSNDCNDPGHTFTNTGIYTVSLTAGGLGGTDNKTRIDYIKVAESDMYSLQLPLVIRD